MVLGARHDEALATLATDIETAGHEAVYRVTDVRRRADLEQLVGLAHERFGRLDVLFSNAGAMPIGPFDELAVEDWETMVDVNIKGVLFGIAAALPVFRRQGSGHFIHTASTSARKTVPEPGRVFGHEGGGARHLGWVEAGTLWSYPGDHDPAGLHGHRFHRSRQEP